MATIAIIGGSGLAEGLEETLDNIQVFPPARNECGIGGKVTSGYSGDTEVVIMPRHGEGKDFRSPATLAKENGYEANIWRLYKLGVEAILAFSAVGWIDEMPLADKGHFVVPDHYMPGSMSPHTFGNDALVLHPNMSVPFDIAVSQRAILAIRAAGYTAADDGFYICNDGDAFETSEQIQVLDFITSAFEGLNRMVGMTAGAELVLAKQLKIPYAVICNPVNPAEGLSDIEVTHDQTLRVMDVAKEMNVHIVDKFLHSYQS